MKARGRFDRPTDTSGMLYDHGDRLDTLERRLSNARVEAVAPTRPIPSFSFGGWVYPATSPRWYPVGPDVALRGMHVSLEYKDPGASVTVALDLNGLLVGTVTIGAGLVGEVAFTRSMTETDYIRARVDVAGSPPLAFNLSVQVRAGTQ